MDITAELARWSQALVGIGQTGLNYANTPYDVERYEELLKLASEMTATINANATLDTKLAAQLALSWKKQATSGGGYVTPNVSVGAIVFNKDDELLLVRNADEGYWVFPVGNADVGYTAAEVAQKEVKEEAGLNVTPLALMAVNDSFRQGFNLHTHIYNLLFYCRLDGGILGPQTVEISQAQFFARDQLPFAREPDWVSRVFAWHDGRSRQPYFD